MSVASIIAILWIKENFLSHFLPSEFSHSILHPGLREKEEKNKQTNKQDLSMIDFQACEKRQRFAYKLRH